MEFAIKCKNLKICKAITICRYLLYLESYNLPTFSGNDGESCTIFHYNFEIKLLHAFVSKS